MDVKKKASVVVFNWSYFHKNSSEKKSLAQFIH